MIMSHRPRKRFGQNFLQDNGIIRQIIASIGIMPGDHCIEIGPGQGALTECLVKTGNRIDVIELDRDLADFIRIRYGHCNNLTIHSADALKFDFSGLAVDGKKLRIIGNLPYNISTPLMFHLLENCQIIQDMHFMLQKEVVDRICASPGNKQYGRLSVMMQLHCSAERLFDVPPESFYPAPKVVSSIIRLTPHTKPPVQITDIAYFSQLVSMAFSQRRKTIRNSLKKLIDKDQFCTLSINPELRPENLTLSDFAQLCNESLVDKTPD